ncbi:ABC transporter substrate-binding protein [Rhizobium lusitanum]|uniref:ABC transporter substrate-binding protein n=1 Tax=Rhizobium lusitanum TaxID=293958 RepID=UPI0015719796|nr:ABC transporter substrate-binding protein [Rhizobium lusitanum]NTJ11601.1 substrate-binding domain-containing protein [Rhizobium lusitanum]
MKSMFTIAMATALVFGASPVFAQDKGLVVFSQAGMENEWRVMDTKDMEKAFKDAGYDFVWTNANSDPAKQLSDIEDLLARKPVLLVVAPIEYEPLAPVPDMAKKANVPLIVVDRALPGTPGKDNWLALLTTSFVDTGERVGKNVVEDMIKKNGAPKGKLLHITGNKGASPVIDEQAGLDNIFKASPDIQWAATCDGLYSREPGRKCTEDLLQAFSAGTIDGIVFDNDDEMIGGIQAIKAAGRTELLGHLWGKDGTVDALQAMIDGDAKFTVQTPPFFGANALKVFEDYKAGKPVEQKVQYVPKETFDNGTPDHVNRLKARIQELKAMGVGCC